MEDFQIQTWGEAFDVDRFLSRASFTPSRTWHVGESWRFEQQATTSGFEILLSDGAPLEVEEQEAIAIDFLTKHFASFQVCGEDREIQHSILVIQKQVHLDKDLEGFSVEIDRRLISIALQLNMRAVTNVNLVRCDRDG